METQKSSNEIYLLFGIKVYFWLAGIVEVFPYYFVLNETELFVKDHKFNKDTISIWAHKIWVKIVWKLFI